MSQDRTPDDEIVADLFADGCSDDFLEGEDADPDRHPRGTRFRRDGLAFDHFILTLAGFHHLGRRFLLWRYFPPTKEGKKPRKVPVSSWGRPIDYTDERNWLDFGVAVHTAARCGLGLGVALGWGLGGLDLDHALVDAYGDPTEQTRAIIAHFPTFTEVNPSGTGLHCYFYSDPFVSATMKEKGIELYGGLRWFAVSGKTFGVPGDPGRVAPITDCTTAATALLHVLRPPSPRTARPAGPPSTDALRRLEDCGIIRERPSHLGGGSIYKLRRCPFTGEEHDRGGSFAIRFDDGGIHFRCDRSSHGPMRETIPPPRRCPQCNAEFVPHSRDETFCSAECRNAFQLHERTADVPSAGTPSRLRLIPKGSRGRTR